eukprot:CAMPEP_0202465462 /NCGR_PEP_ID=MMETSP1360-20130828/65707_1 /ASSEMBLY_ACC=CAM_ASM_000848 /TAXON_ID=515479 /ORGANISM="Licmophora paradoxa, Strain CCMP2313" /LENGTH=50 /DNA_ID=CAMNT_0049089209 /DNA_START=26 /DNA_END=178 /DNA_ORIENTATION=+
MTSKDNSPPISFGKILDDIPISSNCCKRVCLFLPGYVRYRALMEGPIMNK